MFRFDPRIAAVLLLFVACACSPTAAEERPFNASGNGVVSYGFGSLQGRGRATHLGRSSFGVEGDGNLLPYGFFLAYNGYLTSANGDQIYFAFDSVEYVFDPAIGVVSATLTFTGGTGRFQDASGSAVVMFDFDSSFASFLFKIDGSIDY